MNIYDFLNNGGPGCPGETSRSITKLYVSLRNKGFNYKDAVEMIMRQRRNTYLEISNEEVILEEEIEDAVEFSNEYLPIIIFYDVLVSNVRYSKGSGIEPITQGFSILLDVISDNYDKISGFYSDEYDKEAFKFKASKLFTNISLQNE